MSIELFKIGLKKQNLKRGLYLPNSKKNRLNTQFKPYRIEILNGFSFCPSVNLKFLEIRVINLRCCHGYNKPKKWILKLIVR